MTRPSAFQQGLVGSSKQLGDQISHSQRRARLHVGAGLSPAPAVPKGPSPACHAGPAASRESRRDVQRESVQGQSLHLYRPLPWGLWELREFQARSLWQEGGGQTQFCPGWLCDPGGHLSEPLVPSGHRAADGHLSRHHWQVRMQMGLPPQQGPRPSGTPIPSLPHLGLSAEGLP